MKERIKKLRKFLSLNQTEFGKKLGVSNFAISKIEKGINGISEQIFISICREFKVNENWLRTGEGEMFVQEKVFDFNKFLQEHNATELEIEIMKIYINLDKDIRKKLISDFKNAVSKDNADIQISDNELSITAEPQEYINMPLEELVKLQAKYAAKTAEIESIINFKNEDMDFPDENILA